MPAEIGRMRLVRTYQYGITALHLYRREPVAEAEVPTESTEA